MFMLGRVWLRYATQPCGLELLSPLELGRVQLRFVFWSELRYFWTAVSNRIYRLSEATQPSRGPMKQIEVLQQGASTISICTSAFRRHQM